MRLIRTSSLAKILGVSQHNSLGFDETNLYLIQKDKSTMTILIDSVADFYRTSGVIWDDFTIVCTSGQKHIIDGISSRESQVFTDAFDKEFAKSYYAYHLNRFKPLLLQIPQQNLYWQRGHFKQLSTLAKQIYSSFALRKLPPNLEQSSSFESMALLAKMDWSFHKEHNQRFIREEINAHKNYFDYVEKKPLTERQREAVVLNERSNLVIAGAGSGKTSVMVARVGYVIQKYGIQPHEILLLAFNRSAAQELQERISERLKLSNAKCSTFHALGLEIIAKSNGKKPSLAKTEEDEKELGNLLTSLIEQLMESNSDFTVNITKFFAFPFVKYRSASSFKSELEYDIYLQSNNIRTLKDEKVKSYEEAEIANFLFINQIEYQYEANYQYSTANEQYRQYQPDFYLPEYKIYIEHFGVDEEGNTAPYVDKEQYRQGMEWKRELHQYHETKLIETYSYEKRKGGLSENLSIKLNNLGVVLNPRSVSELIRKMEDEKGKANPIIKLFGTFLNNFKSNQHTFENLIKRAGDDERMLVFLKAFQPLYERYEQHLRSRGEVDFNDMILLAAQKIKSGAFQSPYRFILVDEFQDISVSRAGLVKALLEQNRDNILTAVGDDWQSINRFAGSDISIFKEFGTYFGESDHVALDYTFRYNDKIAEVSKLFIEKNPSQITKNIKTLTSAKENKIHVWWIFEQETDTLFAEIIKKLAKKNEGKEFSVFVLARYWFLLPKNNVILFLKQRYPNITFNLSSIHASKGLEADYVIGIGIDGSKYGFPSAVEDDPLIDIVLAKQEEYEYAEERRLFYVLLTRAKKEIHLIASLYKRSAFSIELEDLIYPVNHYYPDGVKPSFCPQCKEGILRIRKNGDNSFLGCSNYPACCYTEPIHTCPKCLNGNLVLDHSRRFYNCNNSECDHYERACPQCGGLLVKRLNSKTKESFVGCLNYHKGCKFTSKK